MMNVAQWNAICAAARLNPRPLIESCFKIITKNVGVMDPVTLLKLNVPQQRVDRAIIEARNEGRPPRIIVLKARQPGISTLCEAYIFAMALTRPYSRSLIISHLDENAEELFAKTVFMLEGLPVDLRPRFRPPRKDHMMLDAMACLDGVVDLRSSILVGTASGQELWRGLTLQACHLSEFARFPYPRETLLGVLQSVPATPDSLVVVESTAQGMGDVFHEEWCRAASGESGFTPVFIPWFEMPDSIMVVPRGFELSPDEKEIAAEFKVALPGMMWRRFKLSTECGGDVDRFNQEFPSSPAVAFLASGQPCFPTKVLQELLDLAVPNPPERGRFSKERGFLSFRGGELAIWIKPIAGHEYVVSADPSQGIQSKDSDPACIQIIDRTTEEQVGEWHGKVVPTELAHICMGLGRWYNTAIIAPELNGGHGYGMIETFKSEFYERLYVFTRPDRIKGTVSNFLGWETNHRTRVLMVDTMHWVLANRAFKIRSPECIKEAMEFNRQEHTGRPQGLHHDDRIMALMIALRVHMESPMDATGMPPHLNIPGEDVGVGEKPRRENPPEPGLGAGVWAAVDAELSRKRAKSQPGWMDYDQPDFPVEMEDPDGEWFPPGGFY